MSDANTGLTKYIQAAIRRTLESKSIRKFNSNSRSLLVEATKIQGVRRTWHWQRYALAECSLVLRVSLNINSLNDVIKFKEKKLVPLPGRLGIIGAPPVAISMWFAEYCSPLTSTTPLLTNCATPCTTETSLCQQIDSKCLTLRLTKQSINIYKVQHSRHPRELLWFHFCDLL